MPHDPWIVITEVRELKGGLDSYKYELTDAAPPNPNPARVLRETYQAIEALKDQRRSATYQ